MNTQLNKILNVLEDFRWHCVNEFIDTYCVDYRRRLKDIKDKGYILESAKCTIHEFHRGGSKMWKLLDTPKNPQNDPKRYQGSTPLPQNPNLGGKTGQIGISVLEPSSVDNAYSQSQLTLV